jgi:hypothetical protein
MSDDLIWISLSYDTSAEISIYLSAELSIAPILSIREHTIKSPLLYRLTRSEDQYMTRPAQSARHCLAKLRKLSIKE